MTNGTEHLSNAEATAREGHGPVAAARAAFLGPRANGASIIKGQTFAIVALSIVAITTTCNSSRAQKWAREEAGRAKYVYIDPTGRAFPMVMGDPSEQPQLNENTLNFHIWDVTQAMFRVARSTSGDDQTWLIRYYMDGAALRHLNKISDDEKIFGSAAEKASLIAAGKVRKVELVSMIPRNAKVDSDGTQTGTYDLTFIARTYTEGNDTPELSRAYRVIYTYTAGTVPKRMTDAHAIKDLRLNNPIMLRIMDMDLREVNIGAIDQVPGNEGVTPGNEANALTPKGVLPAVPNPLQGGPAAPAGAQSNPTTPASK